MLHIVQNCQGANYPGTPWIFLVALCNWTVPSWRLDPGIRDRETKWWHGRTHLINLDPKKCFAAKRFSFVKRSSRSLSGFRSISPWGKNPHRRIESSKRNARAKRRQENKLSKRASKLGQHWPPKRDTAAKLSFLAQTCIRPLHLPVYLMILMYMFIYRSIYSSRFVCIGDSACFSQDQYRYRPDCP